MYSHYILDAAKNTRRQSSHVGARADLSHCSCAAKNRFSHDMAYFHFLTVVCVETFLSHGSQMFMVCP